ncbi:cytochrome P450 monooxygenase-like protein, partial [Lindgomyces ingoldianus]
YLIFSLLRAVYNLTLHPAAKFPGPKLRGAFYFPTYWEVWTGDIVFNWHRMHEKYGPFVRISPHWISIIHPDAWRDIYGQTATKKLIPKDPEIYFTMGNDHIADIADHTRIRRLMSHAFSEQALRSQDSIINLYIDLLIQRLQEKAASNAPVDLVRWLNYTTFDITGDLCFGESFGALENQEDHPWVANIFKGLKFARMFRVLRAYPLIGLPILSLLKMFPALAKARQKHEQFSIDKTMRRLEMKTDRKDFMSYILKHNDEKGMTTAEIMKTMSIVIIAGSETSATLLSGAIFYLLKNPEWMSKLQEEIRITFRDESEMTFAALSQLKIMNAIIQETFRMYPSVPTTLPRLTTKQGAVISNTYIPPNCSVGVAQYPAYRSSRNFTDPDTYAPERFLGDPKYQNDNLSVIQPFSVGPRNCLGQGLAYAEIRTILARLIWHFEMELEESSADWADQKVYILWDKQPLMVKLKLRSG